MQNQTFNIQRLAYLLIVSFLTVHILIIAKGILVPLVFAALFAFLLKPLSELIEKRVDYRPAAIAVTFIIALLPILGVMYFFLIQFLDVFQNIDSISEKIQTAVQDVFIQVNGMLGFSRSEGEQILSENISQFVQTPLSYLGSTLSTSSAFLITFFLTIIYTFLFLLYRDSLKEFYLIQFVEEAKKEAGILLKRLQTIVQKYLYGLGLVIIILAILNSAGLALIGIEYPVFWGALAAFLAIIPYVGTTLGGLLPFLFAIATTGTVWQPLAILVWFFAVQVIEGNLITPNVVGSSIKINPMAALLALIIGGTIWGVSGLILALPLIAILRVLFQQIDILKPVGLLLSDSLYEKEDVFEEKFDKERFRIASFFRKKKSI